MRKTSRSRLVEAAADVVGYWDRLNDLDPLDLKRAMKVEMDERMERLREALDRVR